MTPCRRHRALAAVLAVALAAALAACAPTQGDDGRFDPVGTNNTDFAAAQLVATGDLPVTLDYTTTPGGVLDLVAIANGLNDPDVNPGVSSAAAGSITVLRNDGAGNLTALTTLVTGENPTDVRWADLDGQGDPDLVVLDEFGARVLTFVAPGTEDWPATPNQTVALDSVTAQLEPVDLDGAGGPQDLLLTVPLLDELIALVNANDGSGTLTPSVTTMVLPGKFVAAPLNSGDATLDVAILSKVNSAVTFWAGAGDGTFAQTLPTTAIGVPVTPGSIVGGHLAGYSSTDVAVLSAFSGDDFSTVTVMINQGDGTFVIDREISIQERAHNLFVLDVLPDTPQLDLGALHSSKRYFTIVLSEAAAYAIRTPETTRNPSAVISGDVTGDGIPDVISTEADKRAVGVFAGDGAGGFTRTQIGFTTRLILPHLVDVDGDGQLDLLLLQPASDRLAILLNQH